MFHSWGKQTINPVAATAKEVWKWTIVIQLPAPKETRHKKQAIGKKILCCAHSSKKDLMDWITQLTLAPHMPEGRSHKTARDQGGFDLARTACLVSSCAREQHWKGGSSWNKHSHLDIHYWRGLGDHGPRIDPLKSVNTSGIWNHLYCSQHRRKMSKKALWVEFRAAERNSLNWRTPCSTYQWSVSLRHPESDWKLSSHCRLQKGDVVGSWNSMFFNAICSVIYP